MSSQLGTNIFLTLYPPKGTVTAGKFKISAGNEAILSRKTTNSNGQAFCPTINLDYEGLSQDELSLWVLFHSFITNDNRPLKTYMQTLDGVVTFKDTPFGRDRDYDDFLGTVYFPRNIKVKKSYSELYDAFNKIDEHQLGMVKNLLLELTPGSQYSHSELANYSYWKMVIYFSIVEGILGRQPFCDEKHKCSKCGKEAQHYPVSALEWTKGKLFEIIGETEKAEQYIKIIWGVRQKIRHDTAHSSAYPTPQYVPLKNGDNLYDVNMAIKGFKTDTHALEALVSNMKDVTRILLLNNTLHTGVFPDIEPYIVRSMGGIPPVRNASK
jgi:hypothetical protein